MIQPNICLVFCTAPSEDIARPIAAQLVAEQLAACVSVIPNVYSTYTWEGKVEQQNEVQLLMKTVTTTYPALEKRIVELHPYEVPEILCCPVTTGLPGYLAWVSENSSQG